MNAPDRAARHLRLVRDLPLIVEQAFRAAVREAVFVRGGPVATVLHERARFHLDEFLRGSKMTARTSERSRAALSGFIEAFARSPLARRLWRVPVDRIHVSTLPHWDLVVSAEDGRHFLVRFACEAHRFERQTPLQTATEAVQPIDSVLIYACESATLRRIPVAIAPLIRSA